ncbi:MAG: transcriptional repressor [Candidatus Margulisiibacteriota bacterium]
MRKEKTAFYTLLDAKKLNRTWQRDAVLDVFLKADRHVSAGQLTSLVQKKYPSVGSATVYRTIQLIKESGVACEMDLGEGKKYEPQRGSEHHDHLVCENCATTIEFYDRSLEDCKAKIAKNHGFSMTSHKLVLYGVCKSCQ